MAFIKFANTEEAIRIHTPDGEDFIDLRTDLTKGEINRVVLVAPTGADDRKGALDFVEKFAEIAISDWSVVDENGKKIPFTLKAYHKLAHEPAKWIEETLATHIREYFFKDVEEMEGKPEN